MEFPDIKTVSKELGAAPTQTSPDGSPFYTLPMIHDAKTGAVVSDSVKIAEYLDMTYPDTPRVIPEGTYGLHLAFFDACAELYSPIYQFAVPDMNPKLNPISSEYLMGRYGNVVEMYPGEDTREAEWKKVEDGYEKISKWFNQDSTFISGKSDTPIFADFIVAGVLIWLRKIWGVDSTEWKRITSWQDGRWRDMLGSLEKYE